MATNAAQVSRPLAVAMVELDTTAAGLAAADVVLKAAECRLFKGTTVCPGKFLLLFGGEIAPIREAYSQVEQSFAGHLHDGFVLGHVAEGLLSALVGGSKGPQAGSALGVLETYSASAAIAGADTALKTADISVLEVKLAQGMAGKGVVYLAGAVADVQAALAAAEATIKRNGSFCHSGCLAAPHASLWTSLTQ